MIQWMKEHKNIAISSAVVLLVLIAAFFYGGSDGAHTSDNDSQAGVSTEAVEALGEIGHSQELSTGIDTEELLEAETTSSTGTGSEMESADTTEKATTGVTASASTAPASSDASATSVGSTEVTTEATSEYATEVATEQKNTYSCTISISCTTILNHMDQLDSTKESSVPSNGVILGATSVSFTEGESVYDILRRTCTNAGILLDATGGTAYVRGINNIYELDCGQRSGWMYSVNGTYPNYGCSSYKVQNGDVIQWNYTCEPGDL